MNYTNESKQLMKMTYRRITLFYALMMFISNAYGMSTLGYVLMTVSYGLFALIIYYIEQAFVALAELGDDSKSVHESFNYLSTATLDYIATTYLYHKTGNQTEYYYKKSYHFDQIVDMFGEEMIEERMEKIDSFGVNALSSYKEKHKEQMSTK